MTETERLEKIYGEGYNWFKKLRRAACPNDFKAVWNITSGEQPLSMQMWMMGAQGRELYALEAPYTTLQQGLTPKNVSTKRRNEKRASNQKIGMAKDGIAWQV